MGYSEDLYSVTAGEYFAQGRLIEQPLLIAVCLHLMP